MQVEKHMAEYQDIIVASPHAEGLALTLDRATQWLPTAQAVLKHPVSDHMAAKYKVSLNRHTRPELPLAVHNDDGQLRSVEAR